VLVRGVGGCSWPAGPPTAGTRYIALAGAKVAKFGKTAGQGLESAEAVADAMLAAGRTSGAAAELRVGGKLFTDVSTGGANRVLNPAVKDAVDAVPEAQHAAWRGAPKWVA
jgi:hypothetical protein